MNNDGIAIFVKFPLIYVGMMVHANQNANRTVIVKRGRYVPQMVDVNSHAICQQTVQNLMNTAISNEVMFKTIEK